MSTTPRQPPAKLIKVGSWRRDLAGMEQRRMEAARLFAQGASQAEVARTFGVSAQAASVWYRRWHQGGEPGTLHGLPVAFALTNPKTDEREVLVELLDVEPGLLAERPGLVILADKGYRDAETEAILAAQGVRVLRPAYQGEAPRPGQRLLGPLRQLIESANDTLKGQLDLERHGGRTIEGVTVRVLQRLLALTAAIWHNHKTGQPALRSLTAYDHS